MIFYDTRNPGSQSGDERSRLVGSSRMLTSARPRTLVLVVSDVVIDVAMLGPQGQELGVRQVVPISTGASDTSSLWSAIEQLGEFDRITLVGVDPVGVCGELARQSQRPIRQMSHGALNWVRVISGSGVELVLALAPRFKSSVYADGVELADVDLGAQLVRKQRRIREYLAPRVLERKGADVWVKRIRRTLDEVLAVWSPTTLYLVAPPTLLIPTLPHQVVVVAPRTSLQDALLVWDAEPGIAPHVVTAGLVPTTAAVARTGSSDR
jgi:hypothetical protein